MVTPGYAPEHLGSRRLARITPDQCAQLHEATLQILERTGVQLHLGEAVELVRHAGGQISDGNRVRIPRRLVEWALSVAPRRVVLYNRLGNAVMPLEDFNAFFGPGSDCLNIVDHHTWERRRPTMKDLADGITLCDALKNIDFVMSMFMPSDVDGRIADRYQMEAMLKHTVKPVVFVSYDFQGCLDQVRMAEAVAGSPQALLDKPFVACFVNVTTGLRHNEEALQKLLYMAGKGLPVLYIPASWAGFTGPASMAGNMAIANAGGLAGVVLAQLKREGTPIIIKASGGGVIDMRTMVVPYSAPDRIGWGEALAHHYGLPMFTMAGASDAKLLDEQAGIEATLSMIIDALAGGHIVHDLGYLESGNSGSLAQLAICDEIAGWIRHFLAPVEINAETLALDLIDQLGPEGQFAGTDHTLQHYREHYYPRLCERGTYDGWLAKGGKTLPERAAGRVDENLAAHRPPALPPDAVAAIEAIRRSAEARLESSA